MKKKSIYKSYEAKEMNINLLFLNNKVCVKYKSCYQ